jgi:magnesium transporter
MKNVDDLTQAVLDLTRAAQADRLADINKKLSAWAAIFAVSTLIAGIYGMNFEHMPELEWTFGYPLVLAVMVAICFTLYRFFKRVGWL